MIENGMENSRQRFVNKIRGCMSILKTNLLKLYPKYVVFEHQREQQSSLTEEYPSTYVTVKSFKL